MYKDIVKIRNSHDVIHPIKSVNCLGPMTILDITIPIMSMNHKYLSIDLLE